MKRMHVALAALVVIAVGCKGSETVPEPIANTPPPANPEPAVAPPPNQNVAAATPSPAGAAGSAPAGSAGLASTVHPALLNPGQLKDKAPELYKAQFATSKGNFVVEVHREWAPGAADRFYNLVKAGFFDDTRFFRAIDGFMVQFGISGDPTVAAKWRDQTIPDDPVKQSNKRGYITFATSGPNSRTTQVFINFKDNANLDGMGFSAFGQISKGMDIVDSLYKGYGEGAPRGAGPDQGRIQTEGNAYLDSAFAKLDRVNRATIVP